MIRSVKLENEFGDSIELIGNPYYKVTNIEGLNPAAATINTSSNGIYDGSRFDSSKVNNRNIVITLVVEDPVETNRIALYNYVKPKRYIRFYYKNDIRDVYIDGRVETCEVNPFSQKTTVQISIICPQPYFYDVNTDIISFSGTINLFEFPFSIPVEGVPFSEILTNQMKSVSNIGDIETGLIFEIEATGNIVEPTIYNIDTLERMTLNEELLAGDKLTIDTRNRNKSIKLERDGITTNLINKMSRDSTWLNVAMGVNTFTYKTVYGDENTNLTLYYTNLFQGV